MAASGPRLRASVVLVGGWTVGAILGWGGPTQAAWASDVDDPVRAEAAAMAKAFVPEAANAVTAECIQIHGGVGFTWDCDAHLFYRRAKQNDLLLGYQGWSRDRLADLVLTDSA